MPANQGQRAKVSVLRGRLTPACMETWDKPSRDSEARTEHRILVGPTTALGKKLSFPPYFMALFSPVSFLYW